MPGGGGNAPSGFAFWEDEEGNYFMDELARPFVLGISG